ncbi:DUF2624 domain-containing protein [Aquibacillus salsiterrae]|uniref:DUF2624 domain-containing protein n=1 Tax=Aquibacillus salsiterrae TaxID=2950439 RepID=A0A9X4ADQ4_9BACI|nr:DUF2624 domain-containing protein [Aquibacillus salsiterrae]MDC3415539.1 DUF2624 domain-containing protein [Aquibacillus salsiterrae]
MSNIVKQMVIKKLRSITPNELLGYSKEYGISITKQQAEEITNYLSKTKLNPMEEKDRLKLFKKLAQITDLKTAQKAQKLFAKLVKEYGVESWFK